ncbi:hypothetical protein BC628DRAFT_1335134 [Trametes gibbosa]|nr:hypothetical protein BC628DRAFT_1335134 [Trametes gibbosa]
MTVSQYEIITPLKLKADQTSASSSLSAFCKSIHVYGSSSPVSNITTTFGTAKAKYLPADNIHNAESFDWEDVMVVIAEILPERYALVVKRSLETSDIVEFSAVIQDDWKFVCDEETRTVKWRTPTMTMWSNLRFALIDDFWLFVGQFAEARNYAIRDVYESAAQLQAVVRSFRPLFVVATARNVTNPFDGRPDYSRIPTTNPTSLKLSACHEGW